MLGARERERLPSLPPERKRIQEKEGCGKRNRREASPPARSRECKRCKRGDEGDAGGPRQQRQAAHSAGPHEATPLGEYERCERERQEQRFCVRSLQEERTREHGEVEDGAIRDFRSSEPGSQLMEQDEGQETGGERDEHRRQNDVAAQYPTECAGEVGIEREEGRGRRPLVAMFGDSRVPGAVPVRPGVEGPSHVGKAGVVVLVTAPARVEDQERDHPGEPDETTADHEEDNRARRREFAYLGDELTLGRPAARSDTSKGVPQLYGERRSMT